MIEAERLGKAGAAEKVEVARQLMKASKLCQAVEPHLQAHCKEQGATKGGDIGDGLAVRAASYLEDGMEALEEDCQDSDKLMGPLTHLFGHISRGGESRSYEKSRRKVLNVMMRKIDIVVNPLDLPEVLRRELPDTLLSTRRLSITIRDGFLP
ncbi:uncharacterized protein BO72DRAFT_96050 [Aspergillus fijiensis CBS 313.89]|uniref:Uncharacterized protein n=1 Tax=Aspergillus fijiensis CBS 313.89 TaxID=1448319 RepID=A0A8G1RRX0_9EURO|nr:uncharacterized protein BO72DRAFT_96050 [Aspergillus fijiensis CBS 313.89]RAK77774.1 hypothetical protein BO72DRAFT_96050 [Aspergillus fijiensis CBS 313.89]